MVDPAWTLHIDAMPRRYLPSDQPLNRQIRSTGSSHIPARAFFDNFVFAWTMFDCLQIPTGRLASVQLTDWRQSGQTQLKADLLRSLPT